MTARIVAKAAAIWLVILLLAMLNGVLRESLLMPLLGSAVGLFLSGVLLSALILLVAYLGVPWLQARGGRALLGVGLGWLLATLLFEFAFGLMRGKAMHEILAAHTFEGGNIWPLVLVMTFAAPWLAGKARGMVG